MIGEQMIEGWMIEGALGVGRFLAVLNHYNRRLKDLPKGAAIHWRITEGGQGPGMKPVNVTVPRLRNIRVTAPRLIPAGNIHVSAPRLTQTGNIHTVSNIVVERIDQNMSRSRRAEDGIGIERRLMIVDNVYTVSKRVTEKSWSSLHPLKNEILRLIERVVETGGTEKRQSQR